MHKYAILGVQGCGKGTQAKKLKERLDLVHISVGDIFRWNIQSHTKLAARVKRLISAGRLVDDEVVTEIIRTRLNEHDWNYGFILDGFPRNSKQAEYYLENYDLDAMIEIVVPDEVVLERVMSRRLCSQCGLDYNLIYHRPNVEDQCDVCGGQLVTRADDNEEAVLSRIHDFHTLTKPVLELFRQRTRIVSVDGTVSIENVQTQIRRGLGIHDDSQTQE